jgi:bifunctional DNase/RNase
MKVFGLALDEQSQVPVLVLKDLEGEKVLPIWIGAMEAMAISLALNEVNLPRPMTHDLLLSCIRHLESDVRRVDVVRLEEGTYFAEIEIARGEGTRRVDSRPSDAIALALRAKAPIFVDEKILEEVAKEGKGATPVLKSEEAEKWNELLERFEEDSKYKM